MSTEIKNERISDFFNENPFVRAMVIFSRDKIGFYPEIDPRSQAFYKKMLDEIVADYPEDAQFFLIAGRAYICVIKRQKTVYICETDNTVTVSQVKLELENFIDTQQKQGKLSRFFSSFFDR